MTKPMLTALLLLITFVISGQTMPRAWAVVPAAGSGERFGDDSPKQFSLIQVSN